MSKLNVQEPPQPTSSNSRATSPDATVPAPVAMTADNQNPQTKSYGW